VILFKKKNVSKKLLLFDIIFFTNNDGKPFDDSLFIFASIKCLK